MSCSSDSVRHRLRSAYRECRRAGLPDETLAAFGHALFREPSSKWTAGQLTFAALGFMLASLACDRDPDMLAALGHLTPVLCADPSEGVAQWIARCLRTVSAYIAPETAEAIRQTLLDALHI